MARRSEERSGAVDEPIIPDSVCPNCEAPLRRGRVEQNSWDEHDRYIRLRKCLECGTRYPTMELVIPGTFYEWADGQRYHRARSARRLRGFKNSPLQGRWVRPRRRLLVEVKVWGHK